MESPSAKSLSPDAGQPLHRSAPASAAPAGAAQPLELEELQRRLARAEDELRRARSDVAAAREASDRFLSGVSHELRTPLSAILLWTTLLEEEKLDDEEQLREAVEAIKRSAEEQQALIENLVDTTRVVSGRLRLDRRQQELGPVLTAAIEQVRLEAEAKRITLATSLATATAPIDATRLQQAVRLLLRNAVQATAAGGRVELTCQPEHDQLKLTVADTGAGITPERLTQLFAGPPATTPAKAPRVDAGLGYGLVVAQRIVVGHGGVLTAASDGAGQGATFTLRLPLDEARRLDVAATSTSGTGPEPLRGRSVLLVVDDAERRHALGAALRNAGATVSAVDSAPAAAEASERAYHDAIVCDLALPTVDAGELLRDVREHESEQHQPPAPALALADGDRDSAASANRAAEAQGFARCLPVSVEPAQLVHALAEILRTPRG